MEQAYVPMARWGRDHWRCLVYVEAVMVEMAGFQVGADPRMTANRRHYRVLAEQCPRPNIGCATTLPRCHHTMCRPYHRPRVGMPRLSTHTPNMC